MGNQRDSPRQGILEPDVDPVAPGNLCRFIQSNLEEFLEIQRLTRSRGDGVQSLLLLCALLQLVLTSLQGLSHLVDRLSQGAQFIAPIDSPTGIQLPFTNLL